ncbi:hypothetical protein [Nonomuraea salmonea]
MGAGLRRVRGRPRAAAVQRAVHPALPRRLQLPHPARPGHPPS